MTPTTTIDSDSVELIRRALLNGLDAYGELLRLRELASCCAMRNIAFPEDMHPKETMGGDAAIADFAAALSALS